MGYIHDTLKSFGLVRTDTFGNKQAWRTIPHIGEDYDFPGDSFDRDFPSPVNGVVTYIVDRYKTADRANDKSSFGNFVQIRLKSGYLFMSCHHEKIKVRVGERVVKGQVIATLGATGDSKGTHVHIQINKPGTHNASSGVVNPDTFNFHAEDTADPEKIYLLPRLILLNSMGDWTAAAHILEKVSAPIAVRGVGDALIPHAEQLILIGGPDDISHPNKVHLSGPNATETLISVLRWEP